MRKLQSILQITKNLLLYEWSDKRVIMGFLAGVTVPFYWLKNFLDYVAAVGEPVNILEAFLVVEHEYKSVMFLVLGWFLIVSDAPFVNGNTYYSLCRTKKRSWNLTMVFYILVQAALYTAGVALPMVMASLPWGFVGKMWSSPVYLLSQDFTLSRSEEYGIRFLQRDMMRSMNVLQAFLATVLCFFLYLVLTGLILYTGNLLLGGIWGLAIAFVVHVGGLGMRFLGQIRFALMGYASPGNFADAGGIHLVRPVAVMVVLAAALVAIQCCLIDKVDFKEQMHVHE
ncbi:hypothetical protein D7X98_01180 [bacterium 1XD8-76]|nr:hypothetical protein D7X98_01180 [bacterium 1XD8-76]